MRIHKWWHDWHISILMLKFLVDYITHIKKFYLILYLFVRCFHFLDFRILIPIYDDYTYSIVIIITNKLLTIKNFKSYLIKTYWRSMCIIKRDIKKLTLKWLTRSLSESLVLPMDQRIFALTGLVSLSECQIILCPWRVTIVNGVYVVD